MAFPWAQQYEPKSGLMRWIDQRLPLPRLVYGAVGGGYPVPRNLNNFWNFGVLAGIALGLQIVTGIVLAMHYNANAATAFASPRITDTSAAKMTLIRLRCGPTST
jgi:ubiquinol-cytochrome c reductase cytochrome b subunit